LRYHYFCDSGLCGERAIFLFCCIRIVRMQIPSVLKVVSSSLSPQPPCHVDVPAYSGFPSYICLCMLYCMCVYAHPQVSARCTRCMAFLFGKKSRSTPASRKPCRC